MIFFSRFIKKTNLPLLILFILAACDTPAAINARNLEMQKIEKSDHQYCASLGLNIDESDLKTELYWRCRVVLIKNKTSLTLTLEGIRRNAAIKKLIATISKQYSDSYEKWSDNRNSLFDNKDHESCVYQGHDFNSLKQTVVEDYFICRKRLINEKQIIPPFHKTEYFERPKDGYNIGFAINKKIDKDIEQFETTKEKYPKCIKFFFKRDMLQTCKSNYDQQRQCISKIAPARYQKELQIKIACQKKSYIRFSDSMLKEDFSKMEELEKARLAADMNNGRNFFSIGVDADQLSKFKSEEISAKKESDETKNAEKKLRTQESIKNFNTKNNLYNKTDLTRLRQQFIISCQNAANPEIYAYENNLQKDCDSIVEKWENE